MKNLIIFISLLLILESCGDNNSDNKVDEGFSFLNGNSFLMEVGRFSNSPDVQFPMDELEESDYIVYNGEKIYNVTFSEDGQMVTIQPGDIVGEIVTSGTKDVGFDLTGGVGAGGRFLVWINDNKFEAELTIYGSGIPILWSERGSLL